jgi:hypothetical protein
MSCMCPSRLPLTLLCSSLSSAPSGDISTAHRLPRRPTLSMVRECIARLLVGDRVCVELCLDAGEPVLLLGHPQSLSGRDLVASMTAGVCTLRYVDDTLALVQSDALSRNTVCTCTHHTLISPCSGRSPSWMQWRAHCSHARRVAGRHSHMCSRGECVAACISPHDCTIQHNMTTFDFCSLRKARARGCTRGCPWGCL